MHPAEERESAAERQTQMRGEHQRPKQIPEKWRGKNRRWRVTPECRIGEAKKPGPPDKLKTCPMCGAQCQMQTRKGKCAIRETQTTTVWRCSTCSDGIHKRGTLICEECLGRGAPVKRDAVTETERSAGASGPTEIAQMAGTDVNEADLRRCNRCAEPFVTRRARRQDHGQNCSGGGCDLSFDSTQTNRSWIYTCTTCQRHLCTDCHAKEIGKAPVARATGPTATPPTAAPLPSEPQTNTSHEHLLRLLSKLDALPQLQTIQWIPRGLDRRYATIRLQALDRAMQAAKANTAAPIQRLWSKMALITPHLILRVAPGRKQQEEGMGSIRDEIRKRLALAEKGDLAQLLRGAGTG